MQTPREHFQLSGKSPAWQKVIASVPEFEVACDYALLQLQSEMVPTTISGAPTDPYHAIDANSQMWGARRVIEILRTLHEPVKPPTQPKRETLHY